MSNKNQQHTNRFITRSTHDARTASKLFLALLFFVCFSVLSTAQNRYTAYRPITTTPITTSVADDISDYTASHTAPIHWETDYEFALETAETSSRLLLIYLYADNESDIPAELAALPVASACQRFDTVVLDNCLVRSELSRYVLLKLPVDTKIADENGVETTIYALPGFEHMIGHPGLVVIDFERRNKPYYGKVVGILPFMRGVAPTAEQTDTFLGLTPGKLTQRTLIYAVRTHPDRPQSTDGEPAPVVMQAATDHALYQAERGVLNHYNFGARSYQVKEVLGEGGMPAEICAQSQSGEGLFEGAIACMRAWRYSSAHWSIAKRSHRYYGYDMVRGKNGAWYAVGFFIN